MRSTLFGFNDPTNADVFASYMETRRGNATVERPSVQQVRVVHADAHIHADARQTAQYYGGWTIAEGVA